MVKRVMEVIIENIAQFLWHFVPGLFKQESCFPIKNCSLNTTVYASDQDRHFDTTLRGRREVTAAPYTQKR